MRPSPEPANGIQYTPGGVTRLEALYIFSALAEPSSTKLVRRPRPRSANYSTLWLRLHLRLRLRTRTPAALTCAQVPLQFAAPRRALLHDAGYEARPAPAAAPSAAPLTRCALGRSDSSWAKSAAMSYDVVAMERWMNVLLAQRLDGHAPTALPLARRLGADSARRGQGAAEAGAGRAAYRSGHRRGATRHQRVRRGSTQVLS